MPNLFHCSQKQRKAALRKERRQRKRQALAQARDTGLRQSYSRCQMLLLDCAVNQTEQIILQVLKMKTITFLQRRKMMRITTLLSWKGNPNSNWRSSQAAHLPTLTYPQKQACSCRGAGLPVSSLPSRRFLKLKITLQVNQGKK